MKPQKYSLDLLFFRDTATHALYFAGLRHLFMRECFEHEHAKRFFTVVPPFDARRMLRIY